MHTYINTYVICLFGVRHGHVNWFGWWGGKQVPGKWKWKWRAQLCSTLCDPMDCSLPHSSVHRIFGVGCHFLLQGIFPTQGLNPDLPHCRKLLYRLSHQGSTGREYLFAEFHLWVLLIPCYIDLVNMSWPRSSCLMYLTIMWRATASETQLHLQWTLCEWEMLHCWDENAVFQWSTSDPRLVAQPLCRGVADPVPMAEDPEMNKVPSLPS